MATKLPTPPKGKSKGAPPSKNSIKNNIDKPEPSTIVALNFRVSADFKKDFKIAAATAGITQSELLQKTFRFWEESK
jgi:hypothetical protein